MGIFEAFKKKEAENSFEQDFTSSSEDNNEVDNTNSNFRRDPNSVFPQQDLNQPSFIKQSATDNSQIILDKLELINRKLEDIDRRLQEIERIAKESQ